jgi:hypothetical protein
MLFSGHLLKGSPMHWLSTTASLTTLPNRVNLKQSKWAYCLSLKGKFVFIIALYEDRING